MDLNPAPRLVYSPHPLLALADRQLRFEPFAPGETLAGYLQRVGVDLSRPLAVSLNDRVLTRAEWNTLCPRPGDLITARAAVQGGGDNGDSNVLATVLTIAVLIFAPEFGLLVQGLDIGVSAAAAQALFTVGGVLLINHLTAPPTPRTPGVDAQKDSPTYSLTGAGNRARLYEPLPLIMGTHKMFPDYGARVFSEFIGEDQYLYQIFNFGLSDVTLSGHRIGDTPITNYQGVDIEESGPDGALTLFPDNVDSIAGGALTYAAGWVQRTSSAGSTRLSVEIDGALYSVINGVIYGNEAWIEIEYRAVGSGTWLPFTAPYTLPTWQPVTFYPNGSFVVPPVLNGWKYDTHADGTSGEFQPAWQPGPRSQNFIDGPPEGSVGISGVVWHAIYYYFVTTSGFPIWHTARTPLRRTYTRSVPLGQYEVRVRRLSPDDTGLNSVSQLAWTQLRSYQPQGANYTGQKRVALRIRASGQINGQVDAFNAIASARCEIWTGSAWVLQATSNPAWWYRWFAKGKAIGGRPAFGAQLPDARLDLEAIKLWGAYCAANGLTFNGIVDTQQSCDETLISIARCGRARPTWASGKLGAVWDAAAQPAVAVFGMSNIRRNTFSVQYITGRLADEIVLQFINPDIGWQPDTLRAPVPGVASPVRQASVSLFGCTNLAMAAKAANLLAAAQAYRRRVITWETDMEGLVAAVGDVVILSHDLTQWGYSGRLVSGTTTALVLDRAVPFTPATSHYLGVRFPNGSYGIYDVVYQAGESASITLSLPLPSAPDADANHPPYDYLWFFAPQPTPGKRVKVTSIKPISAHAVRITATDDDPAYYAAENNAYTYNPPAASASVTPVVNNLIASDTLITVGSGFATRIALAWNVQGTTGGARIRVAWEDTERSGFGAFEDLGTTDRRAFEFQGRVSGRARIEVSVFNLHGIVGAGGTATVDYTILGKDRPPANVVSLNIAQNGGTITADWDEVPDVDVVIYDLRYGKPGAVFDAMQPLTTAEAGTSFTTTKLPPGTWRVGIKAVDSSGNVSASAAYDDITITNFQDVMVQAPQAPEWNPAGRAVRLYDDSATLIGVPNNSTLNFGTGNFTVELEIKAHSLDIYSNFMARTNPGDASAGWRCGISSVGRPSFLLSDGVTYIEGDIGTTNINAVSPWRLMWVFDRAANTVTAYINGASAGNVSTATVTGSVNNAYDLYMLYPGVPNGADVDVRFLRVYNRALSPSEALQNYTGDLYTTAGLVLDLKMLEGIGTSLADSSGNGNNGTLYGNASWVTDLGFGNFIRHPTGVLIPDSTKLASEHTKAQLFEQYVPFPVPVSAYEAPEINIGFNDDARVWADSAAALGRGQSGVLNFHTELDYRMAAASYDGFEAWTIGQRNARNFKHRLVMANTAGRVGYLSTFTPVVDQLEHEQSGTGIVVAGGTTVSFPRPFHNVPYIEVDAAGGAALIPAHDLNTTTGFRAFLYTLAGAVATGSVFNWKAKGV